ncbi:hypothetical protein BHAOGJBA_1227 [Methylobacterium hispanicum]|uniref:Uncharacterized protein n=1 Tax=Methylobacterium hispanicum TaxID=270350 RepID=A0AAV4ZHQ8_9HYPH|nr:hypothetical protein [Methylobacterium hispanicum]GJD87722.1 hypothetical protein BHAOGJBA_1227 [Methylobacterium hispanicum]
MGDKLNDGAGLVMDENLLGLANPMSSIAIGRDDLVGEDRPGTGLTRSVRDFIDEGGRAKLKAVRDAEPATGPSPASLGPSEDVRPHRRPTDEDVSENDLRAERQG